MPTLIDTLLVALKLDTKDFNKGRGQVNDGLKDTKDKAVKNAKDTEQSAKDMALMFSKLRGEVIGLFLAFAGAKSIAGFVTNTINATASVGRASAVFGVSTNNLNAWGDALQAAGGQAGEAASLFGKIKGIQADFIRHPDRLNFPLMGQLGFSKREDFDDPEKVMFHLADQYQSELAKAKASGDPGAESRLQATFAQRMQEFLGASNEMIAMVERGRPALEAQIRNFEKTDRVTKADADAAAAFNAELTHLEKAMTGIARGPLTATMGTLADILDHLSGNSDKASERLQVFMLGLWAITHPIDAFLAKLADWHIIGDWGKRPALADGVPIPQAAGGAPSASPAPGGNGGAGPGWEGSGAGFAASHAGAAGVHSYLVKAGFTEEQARGITAGIAAEGGSLGMSSNGAFGLGQWRGKRLAALRARYGAHPTGNQQMEFLVSELRGGDGGGRAVLSQSSAEGVGLAYISKFMRPQGRFLPTLGRYEHQQDLDRDNARMRNALRSGRGNNAGSPTNVTVHVDARGAHDPAAVAHKTGHAVKHALRNRQRVANANTGVN